MHYTEIANSVSLPIILYNVQAGQDAISFPETLADLVTNVKNIVGVKEASGNISQAAKIMSLIGDKVEMYSGNDDQIVPIMSLGGCGVISVLSNVAPRQTHDIVAAYLEGDVKKSCELQLKAIDLVDALFCEVNPIPVKTALNLMGKEVGPMRGPLCEMEEHNVARLKKAMEDYGLL